MMYSEPQSVSNVGGNVLVQPRIRFDSLLSDQNPTSQERRAVAAAKEHLERNLPASIDGYFSVTTEPSHYFVMINYFFVTDQGERFFAPGLHTGVHVSHDFKVTTITPGM